MNKINLIRLGVTCQKHFDMDDDFKIIELPSDVPNPYYKVAIPNKLDFFGHELGLDVQFEEIRLEKLGFRNNFEYIRVGYGKLSNTLLIQEIER